MEACLLLSWIWLLATVCYAGYLEDKPECVIVHVPHLMCGPNVDKVTLTPLYELLSNPYFTNLINKDSANFDSKTQISSGSHSNEGNVNSLDTPYNQNTYGDGFSGGNGFGGQHSLTGSHSNTQRPSYGSPTTYSQSTSGGHLNLQSTQLSPSVHQQGNPSDQHSHLSNQGFGGNQPSYTSSTETAYPRDGSQYYGSTSSHQTGDSSEPTKYPAESNGFSGGNGFGGQHSLTGSHSNTQRPSYGSPTTYSQSTSGGHLNLQSTQLSPSVHQQGNPSDQHSHLSNQGFGGNQPSYTSSTETAYPRDGSQYYGSTSSHQTGDSSEPTKYPAESNGFSGGNGFGGQHSLTGSHSNTQRPTGYGDHPGSSHNLGRASSNDYSSRINYSSNPSTSSEYLTSNQGGYNSDNMYDYSGSKSTGRQFNDGQGIGASNNNYNNNYSSSTNTNSQPNLNFDMKSNLNHHTNSIGNDGNKFSTNNYNLPSHQHSTSSNDITHAPDLNQAAEQHHSMSQSNSYGSPTTYSRSTSGGYLNLQSTQLSPSVHQQGNPSDQHSHPSNQGFGGHQPSYTSSTETAYPRDGSQYYGSTSSHQTGDSSEPTKYPAESNGFSGGNGFGGQHSLTGSHSNTQRPTGYGDHPGSSHNLGRASSNDYSSRINYSSNPSTSSEYLTSNQGGYNSDNMYDYSGSKSTGRQFNDGQGIGASNNNYNNNYGSSTNTNSQPNLNFDMISNLNHHNSIGNDGNKFSTNNYNLPSHQTLTSSNDITHAPDLNQAAEQHHSMSQSNSYGSPTTYSQSTSGGHLNLQSTQLTPSVHQQGNPSDQHSHLSNQGFGGNQPSYTSSTETAYPRDGSQYYGSTSSHQTGDSSEPTKYPAESNGFSGGNGFGGQHSLTGSHSNTQRPTGYGDHPGSSHNLGRASSNDYSSRINYSSNPSTSSEYLTSNQGGYNSDNMYDYSGSKSTGRQFNDGQGIGASNNNYNNNYGSSTNTNSQPNLNFDMKSNLNHHTNSIGNDGNKFSTNNYNLPSHQTLTSSNDITHAPDLNQAAEQHHSMSQSNSYGSPTTYSQSTSGGHLNLQSTQLSPSVHQQGNPSDQHSHLSNQGFGGHQPSYTSSTETAYPRGGSQYYGSTSSHQTGDSSEPTKYPDESNGQYPNYSGNSDNQSYAPVKNNNGANQIISSAKSNSEDGLNNDDSTLSSNHKIGNNLEGNVNTNSANPSGYGSQSEPKSSSSSLTQNVHPESRKEGDPNALQKGEKALSSSSSVSTGGSYKGEGSLTDGHGVETPSNQVSSSEREGSSNMSTLKSGDYPKTPDGSATYNTNHKTGNHGGNFDLAIPIQSTSGENIMYVNPRYLESYCQGYQNTEHTSTKAEDSSELAKENPKGYDIDLRGESKES